MKSGGSIAERERMRKIIIVATFGALSFQAVLFGQLGLLLFAGTFLLVMAAIGTWVERPLEVV